MAALALALVAAIRAADDGRASTATEAHGGNGALSSTEDVPDASATRGGEILKPSVEGDVWVFELEPSPARREVIPGTRITAYAYDGTVPGPEIRVARDGGSTTAP